MSDVIRPIDREPADTVNSRRNQHIQVARVSFLALCLGFFMVMMDATVVTTALPVIGRDLSARLSGLQWVNAGYTLVFASLLLSAGSLGDRLGWRRVFLLGLGLFTMASAACGLAPTLTILIAARFVQAVGAAMVLPTSLALINAGFPDRRQRARAIGVWGGLSGVAAGLGPVLGGVFTSWLGWRSVFFINLPFGVVAIVLTIRLVTAPKPQPGTGLDPVGQLLAFGAVAAVAFGLIQAGRWGFTSAPVLVSLVMGVLAAAGFVLAERAHADPMLPLALLRDRQFSSSALVGGAINFGFYGEIFLISLYFQQVRHYSPLIAGVALMPQPAITSLASALSGRHMARAGARVVMINGLTIGTCGLASAVLVTPTTPYWLLVVPLVAIGFGTGYTMPAATAAIMDAVPGQRAGTASGTVARHTGEPENYTAQAAEVSPEATHRWPRRIRSTA